MAKEYKDHGGSGRVYGSRIVPRIVFAILLITIAFLGWSYWVLLTSHRDTTIKMTQMKADLDSAQAARAELTKLMESCKDELKLARQGEKVMKNAEVGLHEQVKTLEEAKRNVEDEKIKLEQMLKKDLEDCQEASRQEVTKCNTSCDAKISEARRIAEESCQQLQNQQERNQQERNQQAPVVAQESLNTQEKQQQGEQNGVVQQLLTPTQAVNA